jgi:hypothetical protein
LIVPTRCQTPYRPAPPRPDQVDAPGPQDELASLFGLSAEEREEVRSSSATPAARAKRELEEQEEESWF